MKSRRVSPAAFFLPPNFSSKSFPLQKKTIFLLYSRHRKDTVESSQQCNKQMVKYIQSLVLLIFCVMLHGQPLSAHQGDSSFTVSRIGSITKGNSGNEGKAAAINQLLRSPFFDTTICGIVVYDLTDSTTVFQKNESLLLRPASNMKILTSAAALYFDTPSRLFKTTIACTGVLSHGTLRGDIYIKGNGDPEFNTSDVDSLITALKQAGIRQIKGALYGDITALDSLFWGEGWMWDDDLDSDAPYLSALTLNKNCITITVDYKQNGQNIRVSTNPNYGKLKIISNLKHSPGKETAIFVTRDFLRRNNDIVLSGTLGANDTTISHTINLYNPGSLFLSYVKQQMLQRGIRFSGKTAFAKAPESARQLATITKSVHEVLRPLNKNSDNLNAEMVLRLLGSSRVDHGCSAADGLQLIDSLISWAGFNPANYRLADGSGVSYYNLLSAELIAGLLHKLSIAQPKLFSELISTFPAGGIDGTLKNRMTETDMQGRIHAKTGRLSSVSSLSGIADAENKHQYIFSILMQNHARKTKRAHAFQDEICRILVK